MVLAYPAHSHRIRKHQACVLKHTAAHLTHAPGPRLDPARLAGVELCLPSCAYPALRRQPIQLFQASQDPQSAFHQCFPWLHPSFNICSRQNSSGEERRRAWKCGLRNSHPNLTHPSSSEPAPAPTPCKRCWLAISEESETDSHLGGIAVTVTDRGQAHMACCSWCCQACQLQLLTHLTGATAPSLGHVESSCRVHGTTST